MKSPTWEKAIWDDIDLLRPKFSRTARHRGKEPDSVFVVRGVLGGYSLLAFQYIEPGKWERWGIQQNPLADPEKEIRESWSTVLSWIRPLIGQRAVIEVYPRDENILNTAPTRWFWVVPEDELPREFDLLAEAAEPQVCSHCGGTGEARGPLPEDFGTCKHCMGTGLVKVV